MLSRRSDEIEAGRTLRENSPAHGDGVGLIPEKGVALRPFAR
jgi:hypothetical protein